MDWAKFHVSIDGISMLVSGFFNTFPPLRASLLACLGALVLLAPNHAFALNGDITGDGDVNVADVQCLVLAVLDFTPEDPATDPSCLISEAMADLDCDVAINVVDVQLGVGMVLARLIGTNGIPPASDVDADNVHNSCDICPDHWDSDQTDSNGDGVGDACSDLDCAGDPYGLATLDDCDVCDDNPDNNNTTCAKDCADAWGGEATLDDCGV